MAARILLVDDDPDILILLSRCLEKEGFETVQAKTGKDALNLIKHHKLSLILMDVMLPDMDGLEICRKIRDEVEIPIVLMSAKDSNLDKIIGLELGADDYITKPFNLDEISARIKSHIRRDKRLHKSQGLKKEVLQFGELRISKQTYEVFLEDEKVFLSTKEFQILLYLAEHPNMVLSREQIYAAVWGDDFGDISTVTVHMKNIRTKLKRGKDIIKTVWGAGYRFIG